MVSSCKGIQFTHSNKDDCISIVVINGRWNCAAALSLLPFICFVTAILKKLVNITFGDLVLSSYYYKLTNPILKVKKRHGEAHAYHVNFFKIWWVIFIADKLAFGSDCVIHKMESSPIFSGATEEASTLNITTDVAAHPAAAIISMKIAGNSGSSATMLDRLISVQEFWSSSSVGFAMAILIPFYANSSDWWSFPGNWLVEKLKSLKKWRQARSNCDYSRRKRCHH